MSQLQPIRAGHCLPLHLASLFCFELWVLYRSLNLACFGRLQKIPAPGVSPKNSDGLRHSRSHRHHRLQAKEWYGNQGNGILLPSFSATRVIENQQIHNKSTRLIRSLFSNNVSQDTCFKTMLILSDWFSLYFHSTLLIIAIQFDNVSCHVLPADSWTRSILWMTIPSAAITGILCEFMRRRPGLQMPQEKHAPMRVSHPWTVVLRVCFHGCSSLQYFNTPHLVWIEI